jgi:hypothetical protein
VGPGRLELLARGFAGAEIRLSLLDSAGKGPCIERQAGQARFREVLRRLLQREFPAWNIDHLSTAADLEHSLSPLYARARLSFGQQAWAVMAASPGLGADACDNMATFGLIWLDLLRRRERQRIVRGLRLILPSGRWQATAQRLTQLRRDDIHFELYALDRDGGLSKVDLQDCGNLATTLKPCLPLSDPAPPVAGWLEEFRRLPGFEEVPRADGAWSLRVKGLSFGWAGSGALWAGLDEMAPVDDSRFPEVFSWVRELARVRSPEGPDPAHPLRRRYPERWLESVVRRQLETIDSTLLASALYDQVPAMAGGDRGVIDLLARDRHGRLVILELKASEDIQLPLQALDYWMRVCWHLQRDEFEHCGYFRGQPISRHPPRLLLVSPAFDFHPTTETILGYFSPEIEVERVGLAAHWRSRLQVLFRRRGAGRLA